MSDKSIVICVWLLLTLSTLPASTIVCTTYPVWLLTRWVVAGVPNTSVELLTAPNTGCAHGYTLRPGDLVKLQKNDTVLIANGRNVDDHLAAAAIQINKNIRLIKTDIQAFDPHTFASPDTAAAMVQKIARQLSLINPENQKQFRHNLQKIEQELAVLTQRVKKLPIRTKHTVLHHKMFANLLNLTGCSTLLLKHERNDVITAAELTTLIRRTRQHKASMIITETNIHDPAMDIFAQTVQLPVVKLDIMLSGPDNPPANYYLQIMQNNIDKLESASTK